MTETLEDLTTEQRAAVECEDSRIALSASAGSGKTRVIVKRAARLARAGKRVLAFAFTRSAAAELQERVETELRFDPQEVRERVATTTVHGYAYDVVAKASHSREGRFKGFPPTILTEGETLALMHSVRRDMGAEDGNGRSTIKGVTLNECQRVACGRQPGTARSEIYSIVREYHNRLRQGHLTDFDLLVREAVEALKTGSADEKWDHVLVDEAADIDAGLWALVEAITIEGLFACADPRQAIFQWRGGDAAKFLAFAKNATHLQLTVNHRSCAEVVAAANKLMVGTEWERTPMVAKNEGGSVEFYDFLHTHDRHREADAVLARTNAVLDEQQHAFEHFRLPHTRLSRIPEPTEGVTVARAWLRLKVNPWDEAAAETWFKFAGDEARLREVRGRYGEPGHQLNDVDPLTILSPDGREELGRCFHWVANGGTHQSYLLAIARGEVSGRPAPRGEATGPELATVHLAKGREWDRVVVLGDGFRDTDEDRRVAYVAVTRARKHLVVVAGPKTPAWLVEACVSLPRGDVSDAV